VKLFRAKTNFNNFIKDLLVGLRPAPLLDLFKASSAALIPYSFGILVYMEVMSRVARILPSGTSPRSLRRLKQCVVSLTYDLIFLTVGLKKWSTKIEIFSVGEPFSL
jgi:hypothetical protein